MKAMKKSILLVQILGLTLTTSIMAQQNVTVTGTVGKEKAQGDRIVVCVLGTQACMPVRVDTTQLINVAGSLRKLNELPTGLYVEARIKETSKGLSTIEALKVNENKTVLCFDSLSSAESVRLRQLLLSTEGVKRVESVDSSRQAVIEIDSRKLSYQSLENIVSRAGFALE
jgi:hypothetical protein